MSESCPQCQRHTDIIRRLNARIETLEDGIRECAKDFNDYRNPPLNDLLSVVDGTTDITEGNTE